MSNPVRLERWIRLVRQLAKNTRTDSQYFTENGFDELPADDIADALADSARDLEELAVYLEQQMHGANRVGSPRVAPH